ncbi:MAG: hypothetical protein AAFZ15_07865 [Bacteroidota bacterium]
MEKKRNAIKETITQFILIVFSVVLGLYLSERIEDGKKRQESDELLATIKSEVKDNLTLLEDWLPYHQEINKNLDSLSKDAGFIEEFIENKYALLDKLLTRGSFMKRSPASDAWDIAKSHPRIVNIEYKKLLVLSKIYNQQAATFEPATEMFEIFNTKDVNKEKDARSNLFLMSNHWRELVAREEQLMYYYKAANETFDLKDDQNLDN